MKMSILLMSIMFVTVFSACKKGTVDIKASQCAKMTESLVNYHEDDAKDVFDKITKRLKPKTTDSDAIGHKENINTLVSELNTCDGITAELMCYACVETLPAISEIELLLDSSGVQVKRVLDFYTSEDDRLEYKKAHE